MPPPADSVHQLLLSLQSAVLVAYLQRSRWFGGKARSIQRIEIVETIDFGNGACLALVRAHYPQNESELYQLPLLHTAPGAIEAGAAIAEGPGWVLVDALFSADFRAALWQRLTRSSAPAPASRVLSVEQSNSSLLYGERVFVKVFRRIESGVNPDAEILRFLTEERKFPHVPAFVGALEWPVAGGAPALLAIAISAVPNRGDAWAFTLAELRGFYARVTGESSRDPVNAGAVAGPFVTRIAQLGTRTGELHVALGGATTNPDFAPEPLTASDFTTLHDNVLNLWREVTATVPREYESALAALTPLVRQRAQELTTRSISAMKTRTHGDYHLGQVLETDGDFVIIDFEGEPARSLAERRRKQSPVRDVAGMLRSLHYAAHAARPDDSASVQIWAEAWTRLAERTFLDAWREATRGASCRPAQEADLDFLLRAFLLEKAIYEVRYEMNNRPAWLHIPWSGLQRVLGAEGNR